MKHGAVPPAVSAVGARRLARPFAIGLVGLLAAGVEGCSSASSPVVVPNPKNPTEVTLVDFNSGNLVEPSALDAINGVAVSVTASNRWDFVFSLRRDGTAELVPRGALLGDGSAAGLLRSGRSFDALQNAPASGYATQHSTVIQPGDVLVMRSASDPAFGSILCRHYGKLEIVAIDESARTVLLRHLINPNCENRVLIPGSTQ